MVTMEKILLKKIGLIFVILSILIFGLFSWIIYFTESKVAFHDLEEMIEQVEISYNQSKLDEEVTINMFEDDYLNRAYAVDFMLNNNEEINLNVPTLRKIKQLMEVQSIHIIDDTGEIVLSSEQESIGLNLKDYQESEPFVELIDSSDPKAIFVQLDGVSITNKQPVTYIGVKSSSAKYSVVQIGLDRNVLSDLLENNTVESIMRAIPTIYEKTIFVFDRKSENIEGITWNNDQEVNIEHADTKEEFLAVLDSSNEGKLVNINGSFKFLKTQSIDDKIIGAYVDANMVYRTVLLQIVCLLIGISTISICSIMIFRYHLKRYVLKDLSSIEFGIKELMAGNHEVTFETEQPTEFRHITAVLNDWKDSYKYKTERMTRIISSIDRHVAVFECLYSINQNFFSDNVQAILGVNDETWRVISKSPKDFENYLTSLRSHSDEEVITLKNNKFISIVSFNHENEFYGMIMDKTEDVQLKNKIQQELYAAQEVAEIDPLTELTNRAGLKKRVGQYLQDVPREGIMIIFDLDNFKSVNDAQGHPEGDRVLQKFAHCLRASFGERDVIARIGGDEFVVFMYSSIPVEALSNKLQSVLDNIRKELRNYNEHYGLSTSIGVAYVDDLVNTYDDLYKCADDGLYVAKKLGKDRFYINEESFSSTTLN